MTATATLEVGQTAPDFRLRGPGGQYVSLSEYRGKKHVVVVFFPLAFSPVCSHQLPDIQKEIITTPEDDLWAAAGENELLRHWLKKWGSLVGMFENILVLKEHP